MERHHGNGPAGTRHRCVVWHPSAEQAPPKLVESLTRREVDVSTCDDPMSAIAQASIAARTPRGTILILVKPERLALRDQVIGALKTRHPDAAVWKYDEHERPPLQIIDVSRILRSPAADPLPARPTPAPGGPHSLRLIGGILPHRPEDVETVEPVGQTDEADAEPATFLSNEELAMLLSDEPIAPPDVQDQGDRIP